MKIGNEIKNLRLQNNLTQEELSLRCDLSSGFISLLERDLTSPSFDTLVDLLSALGTNPREFFSKKELKKIVYSKKDVITNHHEELGHSISWLINDAQKNEMEPILATIQPNSVLFSDKSHLGEEFGYVLSGKIKIKVGSRQEIAQKGDSFYYESNEVHEISNPYSKEALILMVSSPPSF